MMVKNVMIVPMAGNSGPRVEELQARLWQVVEGVRSGRISSAEARKVTKEINDELRVVDTALRAIRVARRLGSA